MEDLSVKLDDLPDEILLILLSKLCNVEVLYSMIGVNKRLNTIAQDSIFSSSLTLYLLFNCNIVSFADPVLDRFCLQILPKIHHKIQWLNLESSSMKRILLATNYPNLYGLSLCVIDLESVTSLFTVKIASIHALKSQISSLIIDVNKHKKQTSLQDVSTTEFTHIFTIFTNLQYLNIGPSSYWWQRLSFDIPPPTVLSSTLVELHVCVRTFTDCFYLLDGRFKQLRTLYVKIHHISSLILPIDNVEKLPNLRCFSVYSEMRVHVYDELIVPLLQRMFNLEKLELYLKIDRYKGLVDGNDLKEDIINYMTRLNKFTFNIRSFNHLPNQINLQSNEDIQYIFKNLTDNLVVSCVDYFQEKEFSYYHIYSLPYSLKYYDRITNNFPGGIFKYVREVSLFDERPFEHEFFLRIAQSFPFMKKLTVINDKSQKNKLHNDNKDFSIIKFPHLTSLSLIATHDDYIEQFLIDMKMCLPNNLCLSADYESLQRVTHNFKRDATRINCAKVNYACTKFNCRYDTQFPKHFKDYFLHVDIDTIFK